MAVLSESSLHTRRGLRRQGIVHVRETPLGELLHIGRDDGLFTVLAKLHWHACRAIDTLPVDDVVRQVIRYACNIPRDTELNRLNYGDRLALLERRNLGSRGWAKSTHEKQVPGYVKSIWAQWQQGRNQPMPAELLDAAVRAEERHDKFGTDVKIEVSSDDVDALLFDANSADVKGLERLLPQMTLFFEVSPSRYMVTVQTGKHEQLPVFTTQKKFEEYADPSRLRAREPGRVVLQLLAGYPEVGLSLNPIVGCRRHLHWTAEDVARLRRELLQREV
ncbi:hypothetical protein [Lentzea sp. CA-135723]|uniref:hypothetical protein n=1 Tax=Lentzea sp. CA-135723 TaxID=3239950 RepID=UPI003D911327